MADDLQALLDRIHKDGVEKAQADAERITAEARAKAEQILREAGQRAQQTLKQAELDGAAFAERGRRSVEQAARDLVLAIGQAIQKTFGDLVNREVAGTLTPETLRQIVMQVVDAYVRGNPNAGVDVLVSPQDRQALTDFFTARYAEELKRGLQIKTDDSLFRGFKVSVVDQHIEHDFSAEAIAEALSQLLRPHIAGIVRAAVEKMRTDP